MTLRALRVNEVFYSLQGEGARSGSANIFIRFSGCNLTCRQETEGFDCDTEFTSGLTMSSDELIRRALELLGPGVDPAPVGVIFTGGEPGLQLSSELLSEFRTSGFRTLCVETNGTVALPPDLDWISCSPKTAEHTLRIETANELRYVRRAGTGIPKPSISATFHYLSPAFGPAGIEKADLLWCIRLCLENPSWQLSLQQHKLWHLR